MLQPTGPMLPAGAQETRMCRVAIIGGGFSGASLARCLALEAEDDAAPVVVFEPRGDAGAGLAYDTADPALRLNVAAHRMHALADRPEAFAGYLENSGRLAADPDAIFRDMVFARRMDFGAFMQAELAPFLDDGRIVHLRERVAEVRRMADGWLVRGENGSCCLAASLVIAAGHPPAAIPAGLEIDPAGHCRPASAPDAAEGVERDAPVLIVGCGLTALDIMASLDRRGHRGHITLLSRSSMMPRRHDCSGACAFGDFVSDPPRSARELLRRVRMTLAEAAAASVPWQAVFDTLRRQGQAIWQALPAPEQARALRHLRRRYEVHRFRMPPQNAALVDRLGQEGRLDNLAGRIFGSKTTADGVQVDMRIGSDPAVVSRHFARVLVATGPDQRNLFGAWPWLDALRDAGHVTADLHGLGIACDDHCHALRADGAVEDDLFVIGPLTRGTFGEITGVPEIALQTAALAARIAARHREDAASNLPPRSWYRTAG